MEQEELAIRVQHVDPGCVAAAEVGSVIERWALVQRAVAEEWLPPPRAIARQFRAEARVSGAGMPERR